MKILWSVNTISPEIAKELNVSSSHAISWVDAMSKELMKGRDIELAIAAPCLKSDNFEEHERGGITYYLIPKSDTSVDIWKRVLDKFCPEIIHAYGTEGSHNVGLIQAAMGKIPVVISLQGLVGEYSKYYYAALPIKEIIRNYTLGDVLLRRGILEKKRSFEKKAVIERKMIASVNYVEGRSDWDRVYSKKYNRNLKYYYCPRMLREPFWNYHWQHDSCEKYSILVHQATYPIKGLHIALEALADVKRSYPNVTMYIAGDMGFNPKTIKEKLLYTGYTNIVRKKIIDLELTENIVFTGYLSADQMAKKLSEVNVCVIPSSIENAPNALAEAMLVGAPIVASYVGGVPDMLNEGLCGLLYRFDEPEMMAYRIEQYFNDKNLCEEKSRNAVLVSQDRHDPATLIQRIKSIYKDVVNDFKNCGGNR